MWSCGPTHWGTQCSLSLWGEWRFDQSWVRMYLTISNQQSFNKLSEQMLTSNIHLEWLLDSCSLAFPKVSGEFQQSHSFSLFKCKVKMLVSFPNAVLPLTGSFIFPQATYKETRRVKGCLVTRHFTPVCHHRPLLYIYMWSDCIIWDWPRLAKIY